MPAEGERTARRGPRPRGTVRSALVDAGLGLARSGGPDAVGQAYLEFARTEPGLFDTAFAAPDHPAGEDADEPTPLDHLQAALDNLVSAGILAPDRRPNIEYPIWASVHGLAVLLRGPLQSLPQREKKRLEAQMLAFIGAAVS